MSPTARTLAALRELGYVAGVVERRIPGRFISIDFLGCIDIIAAHPDHGLLGGQSCAGASHAARVAKVSAEPRAAVWIAAGGRMEVWSWSKRGAAGKRKLWALRVQIIGASLADTPIADHPAAQEW